jgi:hypothetical protein
MLGIKPVKRLSRMTLSKRQTSGPDLLKNVSSLGKPLAKVL